MKCIVLKKYGGIENFEYVDKPEVPPNSKQISIRIKAIGVNFGDILIRQGFHNESPVPPAVHGSEICGIVEKIGAEIKSDVGFTVGDSVMAFLPDYGGFAEYVVCGPEMVQKIPADASFEEGAAFAANFLTAYLLSSKIAHIRKDEKVLIQTAAGGVGLALVQLCKLYQAKIYCTSSPNKHDRLKKFGADFCFSYEEDLSAKNIGFDVIFDSIGGSSAKKNFKLLDTFGRLCVYGASSFISSNKKVFFTALLNLLKFPFFHPLEIINSSKSVCGLGLLRVDRNNQKVKQAFNEVTQLWTDKKIKPNIDKIFPLSQIGDAQNFLTERKNFGKVILVPDNLMTNKSN